ncbi:hypothetical protein DFH08DRAFT_1053655 [Mycena albidolilacea]|uniref:Uncharacterized protein n=1 Tax=Mycena albidolilacea TaxID=1033008 RepID=A0AAD7ADT6_9AGAR|nr:hypothetical protein DFH08DRAFT_1053655 [Mycena albidolilacea]
MPFFDFEDVVDNIVNEVFLDKQDDDGVYNYERLPKNFLKLALVSRSFLNPVRRSIYRDVRVEGTERFLLLTGQLRFSPQLAKFVKSASLISNCLQFHHIDGIDEGPGWEPRSVSVISLRWFLDVCPQLTQLSISGGDFLLALSSQTPKTIKLTDITLLGCSRCNLSGQTLSCTDDLAAGWLKNIVAFPRLKELDISEFQIGGPGLDAVYGIPSRSSVCTGLAISNMNRRTVPNGLKTLLRSMPTLAELVLDGIAMRLGELKNCLKFVAGTLTLLTITDYHSTEDNAQPWENDAVAVLTQLKTLSLNGVPVTPPFFDTLPPRLEHLRFSGEALTRLPAPAFAAWLRRKDFPLRGVLKKLEVVGQLRANTLNRGPEASNKQVAELAQLCRALGIEWIHKRDRHEDLF